MPVHWYPGHIAKAEKKLRGQLSLVDVILEVLDARIPVSSRYEDPDGLTDKKPCLLILNKADIADGAMNIAWQKYLAEKTGQKVILTSASSAKDISTIVKQATELGKPEIDRLVQKGLLPRPVRVMVLGMPNVGKSSIINKLIKTSKARTGEKAGVTRAAQWIRIHPKLELLDTPGIIPMKLENQANAMKLAMVNSIGEAAYDRTEVAKELINLLFIRYKDLFCGYYNVTEPSIEAVAKSRKLLLSGGNPDIDRASSLVLSDFRKGKTGRITLESPEIPEN